MISAWGVFGLVRRFAESCRLFAAAYGHAFRKQRLRDVQDNDRRHPDRPPEALALARAELGPRTFARLLAASALDLELDEFARRSFAERVAAIPAPPGDG